MDVTALRKAHEELIAVAADGGFGPPPAGEWDAETLLAHVALVDASITASALAIVSGQRTSYDNRPSLDEWNLRRVVSEHAGIEGLIGFIRVQGNVLAEVADSLPESALSVPIPVLIISGDELAVDEPWTLDALIGSIGSYHLPQHTEQLAELRK
jgi:hypothetical protein